MNDAVNLRDGYAELVSEVLLDDSAGGVSGADLPNRSLGKFGVPERRALCISALLLHVTRVFALRAKEQVRRVNARRIVAVMADRKSVWNGAEVELPRQAVSIGHRALGSKRVKASVSGAMALPGPQPARGSLAHFFPEPLNLRGMFRHVLIIPHRWWFLR